MPTADDFIEVTTRNVIKRHWALRELTLGLGAAQTLCGAGNGFTQHDVDRMYGGCYVLTDLPPCKACDKSRQRRIDGRGH